MLHRAADEHAHGTEAEVTTDIAAQRSVLGWHSARSPRSPGTRFQASFRVAGIEQPPDRAVAVYSYWERSACKSLFLNGSTGLPAGCNARMSGPSSASRWDLTILCTVIRTAFGGFRTALCIPKTFRFS